MNRIKNFLLCLVLLALAGILHHVWLEMSGTRIVTPASAAILSNGASQSCKGTGKWHFVKHLLEIFGVQRGRNPRWRDRKCLLGVFERCRQHPVQREDQDDGNTDERQVSEKAPDPFAFT